MITRTEHVYAPIPGIDLAETPHMRIVLDEVGRAGGDLSILEAAPRPSGLVLEPVSTAYVNHGRWVVDCPFAGCWSAQLCSPEDPRYFCVECYNRAVDGAWVPVAFPKPQTMTALERRLLERPDPDDRNWLPSETVRDLERENAELL